MADKFEIGVKEIKSLTPVIVRTKHEYWVKAAIPIARIELIDDELPIVNRLKCDMVFRVSKPDVMWADVGKFIADREVILEHHSGSISYDCFIGCVIKQASYTRDRRRQGFRGRSPCLVMTCHQYPRKMLEESDFRNIGIPGIYIQGGSGNLLVLIITSHLPEDVKYNFLRLLSRAPDPNAIEQLEERLMEVRELSKVEKENLKEASVSLRTESQTIIKKLAKQWVEVEMDIEEKQALIKEQEAVLQQQEAALHQKDEALHQKDEALHQKDEALHQKDEALHQKDEALQQATKEIERLKSLLEDKP